MSKGLGTFCLYCQEEKGDEEKLTNHVLEEHKGSYAYWFALSLQSQPEEP